MILGSGKSPAAAERALQEQIDKLLKDGVSDAELEKARNRFLTGKLLELETNNGKAFFASLDRLGAFIFKDFESGKRKTVY